VLTGIVGVLAIIGVIGSTLAVWARVVIFDSDRVAAAVSNTLSEPEVANALATRITDQVFELVDIEGFVSEALPDQLAPLTPAIIGGAESFVSNRLADVLATDEAQDVVEALVRRAHQAFVQLVEGDGLVDGITVSEGEVTVNLLPLVGRGLTVAQSLGLFSDVELPELTRDGDPAEQIAELESLTGRDLPDDFGQLVVYQSDALAEAEASVAAAQQLVTLFKRAVVVILLVTVALLAATVLLAADRRRAVIVMSLAVVAAILIVRVLVNRVVDRLPDVVVQPGARAAVSSAVGDLAQGLIRLTGLLVVTGLIVAVVAFLTGGSPTAQSIRSRLGAGSTSTRALIDQHRSGTAILAFGAGLLLLMIAGLGWWSLIGALLLAGAGAWALWAPRPGLGATGQ
jgi:hypothetical protein